MRVIIMAWQRDKGMWMSTQERDHEIKRRRLPAVHQNYVGIDSEKQPYFLSIVSQDSGTKSMPLCRVILFRKQVRTEYQKCGWGWSSCYYMTGKRI